MTRTDIVSEDVSFLTLAWHRLAENFLSVKVWFFIWPFVVSTFFLNKLINIELKLVNNVLLTSTDPSTAISIMSQFKNVIDLFNSWLTFNISLVGAVIVAREVWKISVLKKDGAQE